MRISNSKYWPVAVLVACSTLSARAADVVERKGVTTPVTGTITEVTRDGITLTVGSLKKVINVPSNEVVNVKWDKEPAKLNLLRADERAGRLDKAVDGYAEVLKDLTNADRNLKSDVTFLIARGNAKLAMADPAKLKDAISQLDEFVKSNSTSFRYYEAVEQLGRLYVASKDFAKAGSTYAMLRTAPWPDYQMSAQIAEARVQLLGGNVDGALAAFEQVASAPAKEPAEQIRRFEALIGKAICLQKKDQHDNATAVLDEVIRDVPPDATALQAEAYLRQGDSLRAAGKNKPALYAYLHVDLLFAGEDEFHAEALYRLSQLWPTVGHADRAAEDSARLQDRYPNSEWAKQLTGAGRG